MSYRRQILKRSNDWGLVNVFMRLVQRVLLTCQRLGVVLNSWHMNDPQSRLRTGDTTISIRCKAKSRASIGSRFGLMLLVSSLSTTLFAQQPTQSDSGQSGNADCSDPLLTSSSQCSG